MCAFMREILVSMILGYILFHFQSYFFTDEQNSREASASYDGVEVSSIL